MSLSKGGSAMPDDKYYCYVIAPIGDTDTETRANYESLITRLLVPTLGSEVNIKGGTHIREEGQVHEQVRAEIAKAHFCIADISEHNVNVYYEIGFCAARNKPMIFVKRRNSAKVPVDLGIPKWVEYDLSGSGITFLDAYLATQSELFAFYKSITAKLERTSKIGGTNGVNDNGPTKDFIEKLEKIIDEFKQSPIKDTRNDQWLDALS
jgi:hypothetical protein